MWIFVLDSSVLPQPCAYLLWFGEFEWCGADGVGDLTAAFAGGHDQALADDADGLAR